jgi:hypothetical protein
MSDEPQSYPPNYPDSHDPTGPPSTEELLGETTSAGHRHLGPAEEWYCDCIDYGASDGNIYPHVLRRASVIECPVCHAVAPWAERMEAESRV